MLLCSPSVVVVVVKIGAQLYSQVGILPLHIAYFKIALNNECRQKFLFFESL